MDNIFNWIMNNPIPTIIVVIVIFLVLTYNNLNAKKKRVEKSFSTIDVYLEKRFDEISALLEQLERTYEHEETVYEQVSALRSGLATIKSGAINDKVNAVNNFSRMMAIPGLKGEVYPEIQSILNQGLFVMNKTSAVEDDLAAARKQYNNNATSYNTKITSFPTNLVAGMFNFKVPFELFKVSEGKQERPTIMQNRKNDLELKLEMEKMELKAKLEKEAMIKKTELEMQAMEKNNTEETSDITSNDEVLSDDNNKTA